VNLLQKRVEMRKTDMIKECRTRKFSRSVLVAVEFVVCCGDLKK